MSDQSSLLRLPLLAPDSLSEPQKALYARLTRTTKDGYGNAFTTLDTQDRFIGPFGIVMHSPEVGQAFYDVAAALSNMTGLRPAAREVAILVIGAHYKAEYELYAHRALGIRAGLTGEHVDKLSRGIRPSNLKDDENTAFDVAFAIATEPGPLRKELWGRALSTFGMEGSIALVHFVGFYAYTCMILNGFDAKAPV